MPVKDLQVRFPAILGALVAAATLAACAGIAGDATRGAATAPAPVADSATTTTAAATTAVSDVPSELLERVVAEAAGRSSVESDAVEVVAAESVTWSDGSLGCPEPGMMYTQALVPGYRVVVRIGDEELSFHADTSGNFRFCDDPQPPAAGTVDR